MIGDRGLTTSMFGWLTRNDGARIGRAKRRLKSSRASVFSEFALVIPIVVMVCSALIEIVGFWDAQIMANHAAWTVGRIAMVRGKDGMEYWGALSKKAKAGVTSESMPQSLQAALEPVNKALGVANVFNNRANLATMFLMSTCGIGYYGGTPGKTLSSGLNALIDGGVDALTKGLPDVIVGSVTNAVCDITLPSIVGGGSLGLSEIVQNLVGKVVKEIVDAAITPITDALSKLLKDAINAILGENGIKLDKLLASDTVGARRTRQIYGAASRIARAHARAEKAKEEKKGDVSEVVTIEDLDDQEDYYLFTLNGIMGRLVYPQVVDEEAKSDGFFVTGAHGWPPNNQGLAMIHVKIDWPYEYGWLFPVVSGYGEASAPPVATGHAMVFPQPDIENENLYSEGAKAYEQGSYVNGLNSSIFDDIVKDMKEYLKKVQFCMRYRICEDSITFKSGPFHWGDVYYWKYIPELKELWPFNAAKGGSYPVGGDYAKCWKELTGSTDQSPSEDNLKERLSGYRGKEYFYWDGSYHKRYGTSLCYARGNAGLAEWYEGREETYWEYGGMHKRREELSAGLTYNNSTTNLYVRYVPNLSKLLDDWLEDHWLHYFMYKSTLRDEMRKVERGEMQLSELLDELRDRYLPASLYRKLKRSLKKEIEKAEENPDEGSTRYSFNNAYADNQYAITAACGQDISAGTLYDAIVAFAEKNKVNVHNIVKWQSGIDLASWKTLDMEVHQAAKTADGSFAVIMNLLEKEIAEIRDALDEKKVSGGDPEDPVFDMDDKEALENPEEAKSKAQAKWNKKKEELRGVLAQIDAAAVRLRNQWTTYRNAVSNFKNERAKCANEYFSYACIKALIAAKSLSVFEQDADTFSIPANAMPYNIYNGTTQMLAAIKAYQEKLDASYRLEAEYGSILGSSSAKSAKKGGLTLEDLVGKGGDVKEDTPGNLSPGCDDGDIIKKDRQTFEGGVWRWK